MYVSTVDINKDYTLASPPEILQDLKGIGLPTELYTSQFVVSANETVEFSILLDAFDFSVDLFFDAGNGVITTIPAQYGNATITAQYSADGLYTPILSARKFINPNVVSVATYNNYITVKTDNVTYDPDSKRKIFSELELPYDRATLNIKPSEFVKDSTFNNVVDKYFVNLNYLIDQSIIYSQDLPYVWTDWFDGNKWNLGLPLSTGTLSANDIVKYNNQFITVENNTIVIREDDYNLTITETLSTITESEIFNNISGISLYENNLLVVDAIKNSFFILDLNADTYTSSLYLGGIGQENDKYRFNSPQSGYFDSYGILIADTNNYCVKQYTKTYHWAFTYNTTSKPLKIVRNSSNIFVLCEDKKIYVFSEFGEQPIHIISNVVQSPMTLIVDNFNEELLYIFGDKSVVLLNGEFAVVALNTNFPTVTNVFQEDKKYYAVGPGFVGRFGDFLTYTQIGEDAITTKMWNKVAIYVDWREYDQHLMYNDSFAKMRDNLKVFLASIVQIPVNYFDFDGNFIYQDFETIVDSPSLSSLSSDCDFSHSFIGINEIESYDVLTREWNKIWDLMECVKIAISSRKRHPIDDPDNCLRWSSTKLTFNYNDNTLSWPLSWEELQCDESSIAGTIRGILPQHWTWFWLRSERKNAPTWNSLICDALPDPAINTWAEMEYNADYVTQYTWQTTSSLSALSTDYYSLTCTPVWDGITWDMCRPPVDNPYDTWKNLDCCDITYNVLPYDFYQEAPPVSMFAWNSLKCLEVSG